MPETLHRLAAALLSEYEGAGYMVATAESCTGGMIAAVLTDIAGSSSVFERGFVTYSNVAKTEMLGVPAALINTHGAVSAEVAVAVTGIAGPGGATDTKPVGRVYIATAVRRGSATAKEYTFTGDRSAVRLATVAEALDRLRQARPTAARR